tara:strand:+ start:1076 stop:2902 length:1827 start_codon:yes stop_codon:yes gene_type:complete
MPAVANPITFGKASRNYGYSSPSRIGFDDLPYLQRPGMTRGVPTYTVGGGTGKPFRPGVGQRTGGGETGGTIVSGYSPISYNPNTRSGSFDVADGEMGPVSYEDILKEAAVGSLAYGGLGTLSQKLLGTNLTGETLGSGFLGQIPFLGQGLRNLDYAFNPSFKTAMAAAGPWGATKHGIGEAGKFLSNNTYALTPGQGSLYTGGGPFSGPIGTLAGNIGSGIGSLAQMAGRSFVDTVNATNTFPGVIGSSPMPVYVATDGSVQPLANLGYKNFYNNTIGKLFPNSKFDMSSAVNTPTTSPTAEVIPKQAADFTGISGFFNKPRSWIPGVTGAENANATGLFGGGQPGQGITSVGNVLGTIGGLLSLRDFIKDPNLASGLGTLAGAGASGISAFSGLATAAPWLAGAALVASLLMNKKPSNKTGYTTIDLDEFKPLSFGMEGKKYSQENVDQTSQIMEPIIPLIQELEKQYGVDLKGDIQVNYGGRDGLAYNIGNRDVTGFRNRLDYFDGRDQSTRDGGSIFRKTFKGENAGKDFYNSLLGDLETLAKQKQAEGGGVIDLSGYRGAQRQTPQGVFSYGLPGGGMIPDNITAPPKPKGGPQGVFTYGYNT